MNIPTIYTATPADLSPPVQTESFCVDLVLATDYQKLKDEFKQLAAENVAMRETIDAVRGVADNSSGIAGWHLNGEIAKWSEILPEIDDIETPATDRIVAGIKADGRAEGINFAASRLAAAFNHGFVDKPMAEVGDVVRMILDAKADLANDPVLAADGLSGEYAEKSLAEWETELREEADK